MSCKDYQDRFIDYLENTVNKQEASELESHLKGCLACQKEFQEIREMVSILEKEEETIQIPNHFMSNVRRKVKETERKNKKSRKRQSVIGLAAALFLTVFAGTAVATNGFTTLFDWWKDLSNKESEQLQQYIEEGVGEDLNLEVESNGIKVKITGVVADEIQTFVYYEVENTNGIDKYMIDYSNGLEIANQDELWTSGSEIFASPVNNQLYLYSEDENSYKGRLGVLPMSELEGTIELKLSKLQKVTNDPSNQEAISTDKKEDAEYIEGEWSFEVPVKKQSVRVDELNLETEVEGHQVVFDKITIAPTATILSYRYQEGQTDKKLEFIEIASLETREKQVLSLPFHSGGFSENEAGSGWVSAEAVFESLYLEKPEEITVNLGQLQYFVQNKEVFEVDVTNAFPQTFEYLENKISIEKMELGNPTRFVITEELPADRKYEMLRYRVFNKDGHGSTASSINGYYIDKKGDQYKLMDYMFRKNELEQPKFFSTEHRVEMSGEGQTGQVIPVGIEIEGYTTSVYTDKKIEITLD